MFWHFSGGLRCMPLAPKVRWRSRNWLAIESRVASHLVLPFSEIGFNTDVATWLLITPTTKVELMRESWLFTQSYWDNRFSPLRLLTMKICQRFFSNEAWFLTHHFSPFFTTLKPPMNQLRCWPAGSNWRGWGRTVVGGAVQTGVRRCPPWGSHSSGCVSHQLIYGGITTLYGYDRMMQLCNAIINTWQIWYDMVRLEVWI